MNRTYCTQSDLRYLARTLAMIRSLRRAVPDVTVWLLCLDDATHALLSRNEEPGVRLISSSALEAGDLQLAAAKMDGRNAIEYYFTCKPPLIAYVFGREPVAEFVSYLDGDLYFFANPEPLFAEAGNASIILTPHRFPPALQHLLAHGFFNAGFLSFRRTAEGLACLEWWRRQCIAWCFDWPDEEGERHGDQRYLDKFPALFPGTFASGNLGANLAPWNVGPLRLEDREDQVVIEGRDTLLFFHFHGVKPLGPHLYQTSHDVYRAPLSPLMRRMLYLPYLKEVRGIDRDLAPHMTGSAGKELVRAPPGPMPVEFLKKGIRLARSWVRNSLVRVTD
jgi:hypothetical protein